MTLKSYQFHKKIMKRDEKIGNIGHENVQFLQNSRDLKAQAFCQMEQQHRIGIERGDRGSEADHHSWRAPGREDSQHRHFGAHRFGQDDRHGEDPILCRKDRLNA